MSLTVARGRSCPERRRLAMECRAPESFAAAAACASSATCAAHPSRSRSTACETWERCDRSRCSATASRRRRAGRSAQPWRGSTMRCWRKRGWATTDRQEHFCQIPMAGRRFNAKHHFDQEHARFWRRRARRARCSSDRSGGVEDANCAVSQDVQCLRG